MFESVKGITAVISNCSWDHLQGILTPEDVELFNLRSAAVMPDFDVALSHVEDLVAYRVIQVYLESPHFGESKTKARDALLLTFDREDVEWVLYTFRTCSGMADPVGISTRHMLLASADDVYRLVQRHDDGADFDHDT